VSNIAARTRAEWQSFHCEAAPDGDAVRITPVGELDMATSRDFAAAVQRARENDPARLVLDLTEVTFIDSTGIRAVLKVRQEAERGGVPCAVVPGPPAVQRAFAVAGLADLLA
jgi:anti-anti-sigma factor